MIPTPGPIPISRRSGSSRPAAPARAATTGSTRRRGPRVLLVALGAALLLLFGSTGAFAHAEMQITTPANGAALDAAPARVTVAFTDAVQVSSDGVRVFAADGTRVDRADAALSPDTPNTIAATLRSGLPDGTYTVAWRVTSADSHPVHGAFAFTVGAPGSGAGPLTGVDQENDRLVAALVLLSRGVGYAGLALLIGAAGILALATGGTDRRRPRRLARTGALAVFGSAVVSLLAQGPYTAGSGLGGLLDPALLRNTLDARPGLAMLARAVLAAVVLVLPALREPRATPPATDREGVRAVQLLVPAVALAATFAVAGHAMTGRQVPLAVVVDILHLTAMGLWLGGLVTLGVLCVRPAAPKALGATIRRFSTLAVWCVGVLVVTGVHQTRRQIGAPADLLTTGYGRVLTAKVAVVLVLIGLGYAARRWTQRHARPESPPAPDAVRRMRRTLAIEASVGVVVLALSAVLSSSAPPREAVASSTVAPPTVTAPAPQTSPAPMTTLEAHYDTGKGVEGTGTVTVGFTQKTVGRYDLDLRLTGPTGKPFTPQEVTATLSLPANNLGPLPVALAARETGHWQAEANLVPIGDWLLTVTVRTSDIDQDSVSFAASNAALDAITKTFTGVR